MPPPVRTRLFNTLSAGLSTSANAALQTAPSANLPVFSLADQTPGGYPPGAVIDAASKLSSTVYRYPDETAPYYFSLAIQDYKRNNWLQLAELEPVATVALPMPQKMVDNHRVEYDFLDLQEMGLAHNEAMNQWNSIQGNGSVLGALGGLATSTGTRTLGVAGQAIPQSVGYAVNNFLTVMLKGPVYKRRDFQWHFSPKTAHESESLRNIISLLNQSMAPSLPGTLGSAFFGWPRVMRPAFNYADPSPMVLHGSNDLGDWTFHMKVGVLIDLVADYTPQGTWSAYATTKAPESIDLHLGFLELEFWLRESNWGPGFRGLTNTGTPSTSTPTPTTPPVVNPPGGGPQQGAGGGRPRNRRPGT